MTQRWCDIDDEHRTPEQKKTALWSYYMTFYNSSHGRECSADLRRIVEKFKTDRKTTEDGIAALALDDFIRIIRENSGVTGEYVVVQAEQKTAILKVQPEQGIEMEGFE